MGLGFYVLKRILVIPVILFIIVSINFGLIHLAPGDPALILAGELASEEYVEHLRHVYGLDKPLLEQFSIYVSSVFRGDFGRSYKWHNVGVSDLILSRLPATLLLTVPSMFLSSTIGTLLGVYVAKKQGSKVASSINYGSLILNSLPIFWAGLILLIVFAVYLRWFPTSGMHTLGGPKGIAYYIDTLWHLAMPLLTLTLVDIPVYLRVARSSVIDTMEEDFVTALRATGLKETTIFFRHILRNALLPVVTIGGIYIGYLFSGAVLTETVWGWPGMGKLVYQAIAMRDYPVILGAFFLTSLVVLISTLIVDVLYAFLDPRIRYG